MAKVEYILIQNENIIELDDLPLKDYQAVDLKSYLENITENIEPKKLQEIPEKWFPSLTQHFNLIKQNGLSQEKTQESFDINIIQECFNILGSYKNIERLSNNFNNLKERLTQKDSRKWNSAESCFVQLNSEPILACSKAEESSTSNGDGEIKEIDEIMNQAQELKKEIEKLEGFEDFKNSVEPKNYIPAVKNYSGTRGLFSILLRICRYHFPLKTDAILKIIDMIFSAYNINVIYKLKEKVKKEFKEKIQNSKPEFKYYFLDYFIHVILSRLLNNGVLANETQIEKDQNNQFISEISKINQFSSDLFEIKEEEMFSDKTYSSKVYYDRNFSFFLELNYTESNNTISKKLDFSYYTENISKFVVHSLKNDNDKKVMVPYFPLGTLYYIFFYTKKSESNLHLSYVDKIVILYEIAIALNDLHKIGKFHGNLSDKSIFLNSSKDAYIGAFFNNERAEKFDSRTKYSPIFFRSPEKIKLIDDDNYSFSEEIQQANDIYSFGVIINEIFSEVFPYTRFEKSAREEQKTTLKNPTNYFSILFSETDSNNKCFDPFYTDENWNSLYGFKEIAQKCIKEANLIDSMEEVINLIKLTPIYQRNKEEIEFRIRNARASNEYNCSFVDLLESYYRGFDEVESLIDALTKNKSDNRFFEDKIAQIFKNFDVQDTNAYIFGDIFNYLIKRHTYNTMLDSNSIIPMNDPLYKFSLFYNNLQVNRIIKTNEFITPCTSMNCFTQSFKNDNFLPWTYILAEELSIIHSNKLFVGNLKENMIGVYFNDEIKSFVPSIILYYSYYNRMKNVKHSPKITNTKSLLDYQKKDVDFFLSLIKKYGDENKIMFNQISNLEFFDSINSILLYLHNKMIENNLNFNGNYFYDYKYFNKSYNSIVQICTSFKKANDATLDDALLNDINGSLSEIQTFMDNSIKNHGNSIRNNLPQIINSAKEKQDPLELISNIGDKCSVLYEKISSNFENKNAKEKEIDKEKTNEGKFLRTFVSSKKTKERRRVEDQKIYYKSRFNSQLFNECEKPWFLKPIPKTLEISDLYLSSAEALIKRYFYSLNSSINYKITIKILSNSKSRYMNEKITYQNIQSILDKIDIKKDVMNGNQCIIVKVYKADDTDSKSGK